MISSKNKIENKKDENQPNLYKKSKRNINKHKNNDNHWTSGSQHGTGGVKDICERSVPPSLTWDSSRKIQSKRAIKNLLN